jgi:hypothetical protein
MRKQCPHCNIRERLAEEIREELSKRDRHLRKAQEHAIKAGAVLWSAEADVSPQDWPLWLSYNCNLLESEAGSLMSITEKKWERQR